MTRRDAAGRVPAQASLLAGDLHARRPGGAPWKPSKAVDPPNPATAAESVGLVREGRRREKENVVLGQ